MPPLAGSGLDVKRQFNMLKVLIEVYFHEFAFLDFFYEIRNSSGVM